jgi:hypothetical protein
VIGTVGDNRSKPALYEVDKVDCLVAVSSCLRIWRLTCFRCGASSANSSAERRVRMRFGVAGERLVGIALTGYGQEHSNLLAVCALTVCRRCFTIRSIGGLSRKDSGQDYLLIRRADRGFFAAISLVGDQYKSLEEARLSSQLHRLPLQALITARSHAHDGVVDRWIHQLPGLTRSDQMVGGGTRVVPLMPRHRGTIRSSITRSTA